jgi:phage terminase large subunit-like protein
LAALDEQALDFMASLVLEDGRRWGQAATRYQWTDAQENLRVDSPTPYSLQTRSRGSGKTTDLAGVLVSAMVVQAPVGARLYSVASDRDQGALLVDSIRGFVDRTPGLRGLLEISAYTVRVSGTGVRLDVLAADAPGAWGLRPYFVAIDEIAMWADSPSSRAIYEALRTSVSKCNARMVLITTAGDPAHFSYEIREHALSDPLWRVNEVLGPPPWIDAERLEEQRRALSESAYRRLYLNEWTEAEDALTTLEDLLACATLEGPLPPRRNAMYSIGVDVGVTRDRTAVAICHVDLYPDPIYGPELGPVFVDQVRTWTGSRERPIELAEVRETVKELAVQYNWAQVVIDPWQGIGIAQELRAQRLIIKQHQFAVASNGRLANTLRVLLRDRKLCIPNDPDLIHELSRVRLRETSPGVMRLDHAPGQHDDRAIAIALAATDAIETAAAPKPRIRALN